MQRPGPERCLERPIRRWCMEHPLKRTTPGIGQMDFASSLERHTRRDTSDRCLDRIELQLRVSPGTKCHLAVHRRLGLRQFELSLPLAEQIPCMIHGPDVRHQHCRMLSWHVLAPSLKEHRQGYG